MTEVFTQVLTQDDINGNGILQSAGAVAGDTITITRPEAAPADTAPAPKVGDTCTAEDGRPGTLQDDGTGKLVCVPTEAPAPADTTVTPPAPAEVAQEAVTLSEGDACTLPDGKPGVLKAQGSKAAGDLVLVCVPAPVGDNAAAPVA